MAAGLARGQETQPVDPLRDALDQLLGRVLNPQPKTPQERFFAAAAKGELGSVRSFLDAGMHVDAVDERGNSALMVAAWKGQAGAVALLAERGADVDLQDSYGKSALFIAAWFDRVPVVKELLARHANTELVAREPGPSGTALCVAVDKANEEVVGLLLAAGADLTATNGEGVTPLANARDSRRAVYKRITAALEAEATRRLTALGDELRALREEGGVLDTDLALDPVTSRASLEAAQQKLERWQAIAKRGEEIAALLPRLGGTVDASLATWLRDTAQAQERAATRIAAATKVVEAAALRAQLDANWAEATRIQGELGRPARKASERSRRRELLSTLQRLIEERRQLASGLDEKEAAAERTRIATLTKKAEQLAGAAASEQRAADAAELSGAFRQLQAEEKAQRDRYSLAFGTAKQLPEARRRLDLLRQMESNRRAAGSAEPAAAAQLKEIRQQIDQLVAQNPGLRG